MVAELNYSKLEVKNLFPTPVVTGMVENAVALNLELMAVINQRMMTQASVSKTNRGGWQSDTDFADWSGAAGATLLSIGRQLGMHLTLMQQGTQLQPMQDVWKVNAWANVNQPNHANAAHHHAGAYWSGVYYVDVGGLEENEKFEGELEFHDPRGVMPLLYAPVLRFGIKGCLTAGIVEEHRPKAGQIVLFPSWLVHAVRPYLGTTQRVSIAFNLCI